jgi:glycosyltransferase involved in cell wall biosynthesis
MIQTSSDRRLPRLAYIGDVPVENTYHGSALLHRLFSDYPPENLQVVETVFRPSLAERRLPNVNYQTWKPGSRGLLYSRFSPFYSAWLHWKASLQWKQVQRLVESFRPEALVTVVHGYGWISAARIAEASQIPLHLIMHDDWPRLCALPEQFRPLMERTFRRIYRQASSRLVVSPGMLEAYEKETGVRGKVLYPSRAPGGPVYPCPPDRLRAPLPSPTFAYAGTINTPGYARALRTVAEVLLGLHARLLVFGPLTQADANANGLDLPNVELKGMLKSADLILRLHQEANVLFVPMSFDKADRVNTRMGFPSKLTDYSAAALPLLVWGPEECSAIVWCRSQPGTFTTVTEDSPAALSQACRSLILDGELRSRQAQGSADIGERCFSPQAAGELFRSCLFSGRLPSDPS